MSTNEYIDLHMHTVISDDGEFEPEVIVSKCHEAGIQIMAIADHNSVKAIDKAKQEADRLGISYIPACEFDCTYQGIDLHVLGYGIDYKHDIFKKIEENVISQELKNSTKKLDYTRNLGFDITEEDMKKVSKNGIYTGEMFAEVLLADPRYDDHELLKPYRQGGSRSDNPYVNFYWDYYSQGKPCYTEMKFPSLEEMLEIIHSHGGVSVLAHPGNNLKGKFEVFDDMVKLGIRGVEAFSNYHAPEVNEYFYNKAKEYDLLVTCGSDFHGKTKPAISLGKTGCFIDEHEIEDLLQKYQLQVLHK